MNPAELKGALEAIIYAADEPATLEQLSEATGTGPDEVRAALEEMIAACGADDRGIEIRRVARGYRYSTKPGHHEVVRKFIKSLRPPVRLSMPALETLAVIAYRQPITLPEIHEVRGVNASGVIQTLLDKRLVTTAGRKAVIGRPILYRTTKEFLVRFGLDDMDDLPSLKEFEQFAREALGPEIGLESGPAGEPEAEAAPEAEIAPEAETAPETPPETEAEPVEATAEAETPEAPEAPETPETSETPEEPVESSAPEPQDTEAASEQDLPQDPNASW
ncbi:MAG TPA: SMC-Scp complex subunit ScpB [Candidatus Dormibacteraeota bacterium]|nr:SMC-Scp complex subunit ScpB [Candidatus Dormibacteraeota bacterium]